jgi:hypothetical protein
MVRLFPDLLFFFISLTSCSIPSLRFFDWVKAFSSSFNFCGRCELIFAVAGGLLHVLAIIESFRLAREAGVIIGLLCFDEALLTRPCTEEGVQVQTNDKGKNATHQCVDRTCDAGKSSARQS